MEKQYICPHCKGQLKIAEYIVFSAKTEDRKEGLILLSPKVGDYEALYHKDSTGFMKGDKLEVSCPICQASLEAKDVDENIAKVLMIDEEKNECEIFFSQIIGERCTYKISGQERISYGDDAEVYNHWGNMSDY